MSLETWKIICGRLGQINQIEERSDGDVFGPCLITAHLDDLSPDLQQQWVWLAFLKKYLPSVFIMFIYANSASTDRNRNIVSNILLMVAMCRAAVCTHFSGTRRRVVYLCIKKKRVANLHHWSSILSQNGWQSNKTPKKNSYRAVCTLEDFLFTKYLAHVLSSLLLWLSLFLGRHQKGVSYLIHINKNNW